MKLSALLLAGIAAAGLTLATSQSALANATIGNTAGTFLVGVGPDGELYDNTTGVGFQRVSDGYDPLAPGSPRDSWGVSANGTGAYADYVDYGTSGISSTESFGANGGTVTSDVLSGDLSVTQTYSFAAANVLKISTTVTNTGGIAESVLFQRDIDWDVAPTEFNENSFAGAVPGGSITDSTNYGFDDPDPTVPYGSSCAAGCNVTGDEGGGIKLDLGTLLAGASDSFSYLYAISDTGESVDGLDAQLKGLGAATSYRPRVLRMAPTPTSGRIPRRSPCRLVLQFRNPLRFCCWGRVSLPSGWCVGERSDKLARQRLTNRRAASARCRPVSLYGGIRLPVESGRRP